MRLSDRFFLFLGKLGNTIKDRIALAESNVYVDLVVNKLEANGGLLRGRRDKGEKTLGSLLFRESMTKDEFLALMQREVRFVEPDADSEEPTIDLDDDRRQEQGNG